VEQRLAALEAAAAGLETRLDARTSFGGAGSLASADRGIEVTTRLTALEQRVDALVADIRRLERQIDAALRQAGAAEREAARATGLARDAARIR
jgi:outer membrane murein-binding lipoprotein Lpp